MTIAQIIDLPGAGESDYTAAFALIHPGGAWPEGQLAHFAGPADGGYRVIDVWESRAAYDRFAAAVLAPLGFADVPRVEFPVTSAHLGG